MIGNSGNRFSLGHDPEKWAPVFPRDKREAFARRSCSNRKIERDDDSKKSHPALARERSITQVDVCFRAHDGLKSDLAEGPKSAMCGRLRFGKSFLHGFAALVGAAMC